MRKTTTLLSFVLLAAFGFSVRAQTTALPYYSGFDSPAETFGWNTFRKGSTANGSWTIVPTGGFSPSKYLSHLYPVGGSTPTDDWHVSPAFDFSAGGRIDSLRTNFSGFGTPNSGNGDLVAIYLLRGAQDPAFATSDSILYNFVGTDYVADNMWKLVTNVIIPPTPGTSYIAFRYKTTINWLDVKFDNFRVSSNSGTGIAAQGSSAPEYAYPNPVKVGESIHFLNGIANGMDYELKIFNANGLLLESKMITSGESVKISYPTGTYVYELRRKGEFAGSGKFMVD